MRLHDADKNGLMRVKKVTIFFNIEKINIERNTTFKLKITYVEINYYFYIVLYWDV